MDYNKYETSASSYLSEYTFTSCGINGRIPKLIQYTFKERSIFEKLKEEKDAEEQEKQTDRSYYH